jgi:hypothetical protein
MWFAGDDNIYVLPDLGAHKGDLEFVTVAVDLGFTSVQWMRTEAEYSFERGSDST